MHCQLCLAENLAIQRADPDTTLDERFKVVAKCSLRNKHNSIKISPDKIRFLMPLRTSLARDLFSSVSA